MGQKLLHVISFTCASRPICLWKRVVKKKYTVHLMSHTHKNTLRSKFLTCGWKSTGSRPRHSNCTIVLKVSLSSAFNPADKQHYRDIQTYIVNGIYFVKMLLNALTCFQLAATFNSMFGAAESSSILSVRLNEDKHVV